MRRFSLAIAGALAMLLPYAAYALPEAGKPAPAFTGTNYDDTKVSLSDYKGKIVVLEWTNPGCPFVKKHYGSGNMQKLQRYALDKKVVWITINSSAEGRQGYMTPQQAKETFGLDPITANRYLLDADGTIGHLYGAKTTPHMVVIDKEGNIAYMGAIDSNNSADPKTIDGATNYVSDAIDNLLNGKPVTVSSTQSYGCSIKYKD